MSRSRVFRHTHGHSCAVCRPEVGREPLSSGWAFFRMFGISTFARELAYCAPRATASRDRRSALPAAFVPDDGRGPRWSGVLGGVRRPLSESPVGGAESKTEGGRTWIVTVGTNAAGAGRMKQFGSAAGGGKPDSPEEGSASRGFMPPPIRAPAEEGGNERGSLVQGHGGRPGSWPSDRPERGGPAIEEISKFSRCFLYTPRLLSATKPMSRMIRDMAKEELA